MFENKADQNEMMHIVSFSMGQHCLLMCVCETLSINVISKLLDKLNR